MSSVRVLLFATDTSHPISRCRALHRRSTRTLPPLYLRLSLAAFSRCNPHPSRGNPHPSTTSRLIQLGTSTPPDMPNKAAGLRHSRSSTPFSRLRVDLLSAPPIRVGLGSDAMFLKIGPTDAPAAAVAPGLLTFRAQQVGRPSAASPVTIFDLGSAGLTVSNVSATGDFSVQESCATVAAAGGSCPVQVTFTPTAAGTRTGTLTITDISAGCPRTVALTGTGSSATATPRRQALPSACRRPIQRALRRKLP